MALVLFTINMCAALLAISAAFFWFASTRPRPDPAKLTLIRDGGERANNERQRVASIVARRNRRAAISAGLSALLFAFATIVEAIPLLANAPTGFPVNIFDGDRP